MKGLGAGVDVGVDVVCGDCIASMYICCSMILTLNSNEYARNGCGVCEVIVLSQ